ncbi:D-2-hydroxyacid dehydrogenase [Veronia pacifica]|uniref:Glycerate dehydrogenase n=1 Tax=Veronia pacifica TaxID=1080227 RepID=A0A1C3EQ21_9GAMM|nr:D-2-hydroxyacid dehydrogenase [Veronia pacifica]ODA35326.1 glycerate dehydrogenase [Veronia pacifica]
MEHIVFLDRETIPDHIKIPAPHFPHRWTSYPSTSPDEIEERLKDATIVVTNKVILDKTMLPRLPSLKLIAVAATGYNNVDLSWCHANQLPVCNIRGYATRSVPEHVIAMLFSLRRSLCAYQRDIQNDVWQEKGQFCFFTHPIGDIAGSTLGIFGKGSLGKGVAALAEAVGINVLFAEHKGAGDCRPGYTPFETVLSVADAISLHCPLNEQTHHLIGQPELAMMKPEAIVINAGRGGLVDEHALVNALKSGTIAAAGIDVFTEEPATISNPLVAHAGLPNLLLTPHVAWGSDSSLQALADQLTQNIEAFKSGKPQNLL